MNFIQKFTRLSRPTQMIQWLGMANKRTFSSEAHISPEGLQKLNLVNKTYTELMDLPHITYPDDKLMHITEEDTHSQQYAVSSLGLWNLKTAFQEGSYQIRTANMEQVVKEGEQHSPYASHVETNYFFTKDPELKKRYIRNNSKNLRYGKIIEELDALAGDCSYKYLLESLDPKHFNPETREYFLVTVSVDRIDFISKLDAEKDLRMSAYMLMAKGSTLMVKIDVLQKATNEKEWQQVGDALIVFVARDSKTGKAFKVPDMKISKYDDLGNSMKCFEIGLTIKDWSRDKSLRDMHHKIPDYKESSHFQSFLEQMKRRMVEQPDTVVNMCNTMRKTQILMHGQDRNRHGKMFGGYLMREAFDISWITASLQCPNQPSLALLRVDQVLFLHPVTVGSVMDLQSKVTLIEEIKGIGKVMRVVTKGYNEHKIQTNNFNFLFVVKNPTYDRHILPQTFDEILEYHEAKRRLSYERVLISNDQ